MTKDEALKLALEWFEDVDEEPAYGVQGHQVIAAIKEALAQPEQYDQTALELCDKCGWKTVIPNDCCLNCERKAQPEQEPVATLWQHGETGRTRITMPDDITDCDARWFKAADLYTTPPQRKPLSDEQIQYAFRTNSVMVDNGNAYMVAGKRAINITRAIEAAHGIKGEA